MQDSFFDAAASTPIRQLSTTPIPDMHMFDHMAGFDMSTPPFMRDLARPRFDPDHVTSSLSSLFEDNTILRSNPPSPRPSLSGQSPSLIDLLIPGSVLNARPGSVNVPPINSNRISNTPTLMSPILQHEHFSLPAQMSNDSTLEEDIEEIIRDTQMSNQDVWMPFGGPSNIRSRSSTSSPTLTREDPFHKLYRQPEVQAGSPEMLMLRFDKQTCGILSVKDGPTENPWRTLIWPLARDSPALYHAIASMTAFHTSKEKPALRVDGMEHMRRSIRSLATGIEKMRTDTALATTLVLAFSESWDQHISTGIEHLRGAKILVNQALIAHKKHALSGDDLARLKFLCNTWVYMDVIARLTSIDPDAATEVFKHDDALWTLNTSTYFLPTNADGSTTEIDPLMGCAATLFPLIGRVATLCRRVQKAESNSIAIISQAIELKEAIEQWAPPPGTAFERPEDPSAEIQHALQTAEAYRYATLLYLHQAIPEIPSLTSAQLAKKVLVFLATVPLSSRLVIVQIYPLLAAGCEAWEEEDRGWVRERWASMASRMLIGNIDRCWEVMQEVWARRDMVERERREREVWRRERGSNSITQDSRPTFEEDEGFSFSDMLNGTTTSNSSASGQGGNGKGNGKRKQSNYGSGSGFGFGNGSGSGAGQRRRQDPVTEDMDPDLTVRGRLHWVGVMKDWEWESKFEFSSLHSPAKQDASSMRYIPHLG